MTGPCTNRDLLLGEPDAAPRVTATATPGSPATEVDASDRTGSWEVTDGSYAGYRVDEVLNGNGGQVAGSIPITFADFGVGASNLGFVSVVAFAG